MPIGVGKLGGSVDMPHKETGENFWIHYDSDFIPLAYNSSVNLGWLGAPLILCYLICMYTYGLTAGLLDQLTPLLIKVTLINFHQNW